jgi:peroxiredoxin
MYKLALRLDVGSQAEDFALKDLPGNIVRFRDMMGRGVVLLTFYNGNFDPESVRYLIALKDNYQKLKDLGVEVLAVTPEMPEKAKSTVDSLELPFPVLSDPELKVTKQYDVYNPIMEWCWPAAFVIDKYGTIQYVYRGASSPNTPPVQYMIKKFEQMRKAEEGSENPMATVK